MTVSACSIVEHLDVIMDIGMGDVARFIDSLLDPFFLQAAEEGFRHRVIPAVPAPAHAGLQAMLAAEAPPGVAAVLRSLVRMNQGLLRVAAPHRHQDRVQHEFARQRGFRGPAYDPARVKIHHDGQIKPALPGAHVGNVGHPSPVRSFDGKTALQGIGRQQRHRSPDGPRCPIAMERLDLVDSHETRHAMLAAGLAGFAQIKKNTWGAVDTVAGRVGDADQPEQPLIFPRTIRQGFTQPFVKPAAGHCQNAAHHRGVELVPVGLDEGVLGADTLRDSVDHPLGFLLVGR